MTITKFNSTAIVTNSGKTIDPTICLVQSTNKAETNSTKPISKKEMKERFNLTSSEADWAHRQILIRFKAAMAAGFAILAADPTVGGVGMKETKGGKTCFELRKMAEPKAAKAVKVDLASKIAAMKAAGMDANAILAALA
jgi:hypothetical protein